MSKKIYLFSLVLLALAFTACSETETVDKYDNWRSRNESFIDSLANVFEAGTDPLLLRIKVEQGNDYIYYKTKTPITVNSVHTEVLGEKPTSTAVVKAFYKGTNILGERFDGFEGADPVDGDSMPLNRIPLQCHSICPVV